MRFPETEMLEIVAHMIPVFVAPMTGVLVTDYWLIRKHKLIIPDLYRQDGIYWYNFGLNWKAFLVFFVVVAPSMRMQSHFL